jgi:hypothetical protein
MFHLELLARSSVARTLKHLKILGYSMEQCLAPTIASFQSLSSLHLSFGGQQSTPDFRYTEFFVEYSKQTHAMKDLKELSLVNLKLELDMLEGTSWPNIEKLEIRNTGLVTDEIPRLLGELFPGLKILKLHEDSISSESISESLRHLPTLQIITARTVSVSAAEKASSYSALTKLVQEKQSLMDIDLKFSKPSSKEAIAHQNAFIKNAKVLLFLHRIDESLKPSTPTVPLGFYPHILEKCESYSGINGLFLALKDKLLSEIGYA